MAVRATRSSTGSVIDNGALDIEEGGSIGDGYSAECKTGYSLCTVTCEPALLGSLCGVMMQAGHTVVAFQRPFKAVQTVTLHRGSDEMEELEALISQL
eukprot:SAG31_NODE_24858_length_473_cov_0.692513_1_plen_97_part_10